MVVKKRKKQRTSKSETTERRDIMTRVKPVAEGDEFLTSLYYGRSGTGKTTLASTYPKRIILLDFKDRGTDSIRDVKGIDILAMDAWSDVEDIYWALHRDKGQYKSVVLDTVAGMQNLAIAKVKEDNNIDESESISRRGWGEVAGLMNTWLMNFRDLPMHVVFLAPDRIKNNTADDEDEEVQPEEGRLEPEVGPAVIPSVARSLNAAVKVIGNTYIRQKQKVKAGKVVEITGYMVRVGPHPYYITQIRSPKSFRTPGSIIDPSFDKIIKIMKGEN